MPLPKLEVVAKDRKDLWWWVRFFFLQGVPALCPTDTDFRAGSGRVSAVEGSGLRGEGFGGGGGGRWSGGGGRGCVTTTGSLRRFRFVFPVSENGRFTRSS